MSRKHKHNVIVNLMQDSWGAWWRVIFKWIDGDAYYPQSKLRWHEKTERSTRATQLNAVGVYNKVMKRLISFSSR
jgi:hypothetical protein